MPLLLIIPLLITGFLVLSGCITVLNAATPAFVERARLDEPDHIASLDLFIAQADNHVDLFTRFSLSLSNKNYIQKPSLSASNILNTPTGITTPAALKFPSQSSLSSSLLSASSLSSEVMGTSSPSSPPQSLAPVRPNIPEQQPILENRPSFLERYSAKAELFCYDASCLDNHFLGNIDIILDHKTHTLSFDQISLESTNGVFLRGNIIFSKSDDPVASGLTSMLYLSDNQIKLEIMGESAAHYQWPEDGHHGFAEFQLRDTNLDLILNLISDIPPQ